MIKKWPLYAGITFLGIGIIFKVVTNLSLVALLLIITGVSFKTFHILSKIKSGEYKPGYELGFLIVGLLVFFSGIYFRSYGSNFNPAFLMTPGIILKVVFIVMFIGKSRVKKN